MPQQSGTRDEQESGRERISRTAYELFRRSGTQSVGVDAVIAGAGAAKMTLYRNFPSKDALIIDFLQRRELLWTQQWLQAEVMATGGRPQDRLLAIFDAFGRWFAGDDFDGCSFLTAMIEIKDVESPARQASVRHLANIRTFIAELATEAGIDRPDDFARQWHILMKGAIMAAHEGDRGAADRAREVGRALLLSRGVEV
jgi:AcrR family transcriptional regulator